MICLSILPIVSHDPQISSDGAAAVDYGADDYLRHHVVPTGFVVLQFHAMDFAAVEY